MIDNKEASFTRLLRPDEVAKIIPGKSKRSLAVDRCQRRDTPPWIRIGGRIYYEPDDLWRWIEAHKVDPARPEAQR
jgi:hypothetical protein